MVRFIAVNVIRREGMQKINDIKRMQVRFPADGLLPLEFYGKKFRPFLTHHG